MTRFVLLATLLLLQSLATLAQDLQHVGDFHDVASADGGGNGQFFKSVEVIQPDFKCLIANLLRWRAIVAKECQ